MFFVSGRPMCGSELQENAGTTVFNLPPPLVAQASMYTAQTSV